MQAPTALYIVIYLVFTQLHEVDAITGTQSTDEWTELHRS